MKMALIKLFHYEGSNCSLDVSEGDAWLWNETRRGEGERGKPEPECGVCLPFNIADLLANNFLTLHRPHGKEKERTAIMKCCVFVSNSNSHSGPFHKSFPLHSFAHSLLKTQVWLFEVESLEGTARSPQRLHLVWSATLYEYVPMTANEGEHFICRHFLPSSTIPWRRSRDGSGKSYADLNWSRRAKVNKDK